MDLKFEYRPHDMAKSRKMKPQIRQNKFHEKNVTILKG
jgi:hypothetical protein